MYGSSDASTKDVLSSRAVRNRTISTTFVIAESTARHQLITLVADRAFALSCSCEFTYVVLWETHCEWADRWSDRRLIVTEAVKKVERCDVADRQHHPQCVNFVTNHVPAAKAGLT